MLFSKTTTYGIRALAYLARQPAGRLCGLQEIAGHERIPPVYLRKVLGELRRHRLLRSAKGIHGGYELARDAAAITLWEVFSLLEPDPYLDTCLLGRGPCETEATCALHGDCQQMKAELVRLLQRRTVSDAAEETDAAPEETDSAGGEAAQADQI
jgi:Rrf2 family protein